MRADKILHRWFVRISTLLLIILAIVIIRTLMDVW
jgi:hypothetical protein